MNRWIFICVLIAHSTSVFSAVAEKEYEQLSIDLVTNFLSRVDKPEPFTFREECEFFGELSLMGAFLYRQYGYIHEDGRWKALFKPRKSLVGNVIQAHRDVFSTRDFEDMDVFYTRCRDPFSNVTVILNRDPAKLLHGWLPATSNRVSKVMRFRVSRTPNGPKLNLCDSSIDGISILYLLGFRERIELYGKGKEKMNALYYGGKSPDT